MVSMRKSNSFILGVHSLLSQNVHRTRCRTAQQLFCAVAEMQHTTTTLLLSAAAPTAGGKKLTANILGYW